MTAIQRLLKTVIILSSAFIFSDMASSWTRLSQWALMFDDFTWLATPVGLYKYDSGGEVFLSEGFPEQPFLIPFEVARDDKEIWGISDSLVARIDLYRGGRYVYTSSDGLPSGRYTCIAFEEDYVWLGSEKGIARFDRLIEQWEYFPLVKESWSDRVQSITKIQSVENYTYFATRDGILRFDMRTEIFTRYDQKDGLLCSSFQDLKLVGDELWCFGSEGIDIFSLSNQSWSFLGLENGFRSTEWRKIEEISGDLYFLHEGGLDICEPSTRRIYPFLREDYLRKYTVYDLVGSSSELWFATDAGLLRYRKENLETGQVESWMLFDESRGSSEKIYHRIAKFGLYVFGLGEINVDVLDTRTEVFLTPLNVQDKLNEIKAGRKEKKIQWDEEGLRTKSLLGCESGIKGNYTYLYQTDGELNFDRHWGKLQPYFRHSSGRSLNGLYDNTDQDQLLYGAMYRGAQTDLLRQMEAGNRVEFKQTHDPFFGRTTLRGGHAMLETGSRRGMKKRSLLRSDWTVGQQITRSAKDFFTGADRPDFHLTHQRLLIGSAQVYLNGRLLQERDYTLDYSVGYLIVTFSGWELLNEGDILEVQYQYRLDEDEISEILSAGEVVVSSGDALQISVSAFDVDYAEAIADTGAQDFRAAQVTLEGRGKILGGEGKVVAGIGAGENENNSEISEAVYTEGSLARGPWTFSGKWLTVTDNLPTLEDRSTEFGALRDENEVGLRYEPGGNLRLEGKTGYRAGARGSEHNYHFSGLLSPTSGTSSYGMVDYFDASSDSLNRERWIASLGFETAFTPGMLRWFRTRSSRLLFLGKISEVKLDSLAKLDSSRTQIRTKSFLTRWTIIPSSKINFYPEVRWIASEKSTANNLFQPFREEFSPRATFYTRNLIPGMTTYLYGDATYLQADYDPVNQTRNLELERQGIAQIDVAPGVYSSLLNPVSLRFSFARNALDSLAFISQDKSLFELGLDWEGYSANVNSQRVHSNALQVTWAPHAHWLITESVSNALATSQPEEQFYSTRIEWKSRSSDQILWRYNSKRSLQSSNDDWRHEPGIEWNRRWSANLYTRGQFTVTVLDESSEKSTKLSPGAYVDRRFNFPWRLGKGILRSDLTVNYYRRTNPTADERLTLSSYLRIDWEMGHAFLWRIRADGDYDYSYITSTEDYTWSIETRLGVRF